MWNYDVKICVGAGGVMCRCNARGVLAACGLFLIMQGVHLTALPDLLPQSNKANKATSNAAQPLPSSASYDFLQISPEKSLGHVKPTVAGFYSSLFRGKHDKILHGDQTVVAENQSEATVLLHAGGIQQNPSWHKGVLQTGSYVNNPDADLADADNGKAKTMPEQFEDRDELPRINDLTNDSVVDKRAFDERTSKRDCSHVATSVHRRRDARRLLRTPVDTTRLARQRRVDPVYPDQEQFNCVSSPNQQRLSKLWTLDRVAAILEYIEVASEDAEVCDSKVCTLNYDLPSTTGLESEFADQITATHQLVNTVNSLLRYETELLESVVSALLLSVVQADDRILLATMAFGSGEGETRHSTSATRNRTTRRVYISRLSGEQGLEGDFVSSQQRDYSTILQQYGSACTEVKCNNWMLKNL